MTLKGVVVRGGSWGTGTMVGVSLADRSPLPCPAPGGLCPHTHTASAEYASTFHPQGTGSAANAS